MATTENRVKLPDRWQFRLYINPNRGESQQLIQILETFCQKFVKDDGISVDIKVVDVVAQPEVVMRDRILATPTLSFNGGKRAQRLVGSFNEVDLFRICFLNPLRARSRDSSAQTADAH
ncbi:MAG TPA: circadian clock KaiB family protein [Methylomirabilota bacterium]|nr:circadian clock KaiB family protein [Methylomirabilota bacterium]